MKRSKINSVIKETIRFLDSYNFKLPVWAYWSLDQWKQNLKFCKNIFDAKLGWDVTDSGGSFEKNGLALFTIRNGVVGNTTHPYCEKIIFMKQGQVCPYHFHKVKVEDIINRFGGELVFRFANSSDKTQKLSKEDISLYIDGIKTTVKADKEIVLQNGQSITIPPYYYHTFYPRGGPILIGEVSTISDDDNDNFFLDEVMRFPKIEENEKIGYPIVNDYINL